MTRLDVARLLDPVTALPGAERVRWVRTESLHLTLRFLGSTVPERVDAIRRAVDLVAAGERRADVVLGGGGAFPSPARPRVLWLGIVAGGERLEQMAHALSVELERVGWPPEGRPFRAHLTVARTDAAPHAIGARVAGELAGRAAGWTSTFAADRIVLFESRLRGGPARYAPLHEAGLGG